MGYYAGAVECPGVFGEGLEDAVHRFQHDMNLNEDKIAGRNVMDMMLRRLGCI
ncbi:peptidoglycan-binding domain-containing protein [[Clostridium] scindens]|uniref:peptidoglycan-binding domain-containing protein n=1 Tax=Clostridium scindens (strain JCM 10418 / VPI 12708) TaxID=29347 RepID=UPI003AB50F7C